MSAVIFESISCLVNHKQTFELSHEEQYLYNLNSILINVFTRKYMNASILDATVVLFVLYIYISINMIKKF